MRCLLGIIFKVKLHDLMQHEFLDSRYLLLITCMRPRDCGAVLYQRLPYIQKIWQSAVGEMSIAHDTHVAEVYILHWQCLSKQFLYTRNHLKKFNAENLW